MHEDLEWGVLHQVPHAPVDYMQEVADVPCGCPVLGVCLSWYVALL
jgi:hypothetical protein